jgi:hypothetical protein
MQAGPPLAIRPVEDEGRRAQFLPATWVNTWRIPDKN